MFEMRGFNNIDVWYGWRYENPVQIKQFARTTNEKSTHHCTKQWLPFYGHGMAKMLYFASFSSLSAKMWNAVIEKSREFRELYTQGFT